MPLPRYFVIIKLVVTTATLPVTCHIRLREATFSHENMAVSVRISQNVGHVEEYLYLGVEQGL